MDSAMITLRSLGLVAAAGALALCAALPARADATCVLRDANGYGWTADTTISSAGPYAVVTANVVYFAPPGGTSCWGTGGTAVNANSMDLAYFSAAGSQHFFQTMVPWWNYTTGGVKTCGAGLVVYAAFLPSPSC